MIDLHCHLDLYPNPKDIVSECERRKLYILSVTTTPSAWRETSKLANGSKRIRTALGLHPQLAKERSGELPLFDALLKETQYVGEIGLDGSPEFQSFWNIQVRVFEHILKKCTDDGGKIMSIHSRRASKEVLELLEKYPSSGIPILHWFSGTVRDLEKAIDLDCWFSVGPAMLRGEKGRNLLKRIPKNRIITETDGPFTSIEEKTLMPWDVEIALASIEQIWGRTSGEAKELIRHNFENLISKNSL